MGAQLQEEPKGKEGDWEALGVNYRHSLRKRRGPKCRRRSFSLLFFVCVCLSFFLFFPFIYFPILRSCWGCRIEESWPTAALGTRGARTTTKTQGRRKKKKKKKKKGWQPSNRPTAATSHLYTRPELGCARGTETSENWGVPNSPSHVTYETPRARCST